MNIEQARFNMIEQQIRPWEVLDQGVLSLLSIVKREDFVPPAYRSMAFVDTQVPLPHGHGRAADRRRNHPCRWRPDREGRPDMAEGPPPQPGDGPSTAALTTYR